MVSMNLRFFSYFFARDQLHSHVDCSSVFVRLLFIADLAQKETKREMDMLKPVVLITGYVS